VYEEPRVQVGRSRRRARAAEPSPRLAADDAISLTLRPSRSALTGAQKRGYREIARTSGGHPHAAAPPGDVGSGKTIVALLSARSRRLRVPDVSWRDRDSRRASMLLLSRLLAKSGLFQRPHGRSKEKPRASSSNSRARINLLVGRTRLLENPVDSCGSGSSVIDEHTRFGVAQRTALSSKATGPEEPHLLVMSARDSRSPGAELYGDLDVSTLDRKAAGRTRSATRSSRIERGGAFREIEAEIRARGQAYVVVPLIEESDKIEARAVK